MKLETAILLLSATALLLWPYADSHAQTYPWDMLKDTDFKRAYRSMLGPKSRERWLARMEGPAGPIEYVAVGQDGEEYMLLRTCKPHMCGTYNIIVLYSPKRNMAYGKLAESYTSSYLGGPPSDVKSALDQHARDG